ncbi:hypothetical protein BV20DRAFT_82057 [Pilatotrama ljubarskyi]|nr:hypothetical protein BV20DRAFT_82057 [Pilatotrama ljubarskyi]
MMMRRTPWCSGTSLCFPYTHIRSPRYSRAYWVCRSTVGSGGPPPERSSALLIFSILMYAVFAQFAQVMVDDIITRGRASELSFCLGPAALGVAGWCPCLQPTSCRRSSSARSMAYSCSCLAALSRFSRAARGRHMPCAVQRLPLQYLTPPARIRAGNAEVAAHLGEGLINRDYEWCERSISAIDNMLGRRAWALQSADLRQAGL